jgi:hypothetical protein
LAYENLWIVFVWSSDFILLSEVYAICNVERSSALLFKTKLKKKEEEEEEEEERKRVVSRYVLRYTL